jgi:hypothetical protein
VLKPWARPATAKLATRRFDVPLERSGQRLVEVVDAEHQPPVGRGEPTEVGEVGVTAELDVEASAVSGREVGGHDVRGTAEERERRRQHPAIPDGDEVRHPRRCLLLEQVDRVAPVG